MKKLLIILNLLPVLAFAQAVLPTSWNFNTPNIENPPAGWSHELGTGNKTYGSTSDYSIRLDQTGEWLQIQFAEKPGILSYQIRSQYGSNPGYTGTFSVQESQNGTDWTSVRQFGNGQLGNALVSYQHNLASASRFVRFFYTDKQSGSNVQIDNVNIQLPPPAGQNIVVKQSNNVLLNNGDFSFGNATSKRFFVQNTGISTDLRIDSVVVSGTNASDFSIGSFDSIVPFNNGLDSFDVAFLAGANGSRFATLKIYSTDSEKNPFTVNLYAIGGLLATEPSTQVAKVNISNVRAYAMNVSFPRVTGTEKYIVLRKNGASLNEIPVDGVTYKRGDYIGGSHVAYIGNDTTLLRPNYILANTFYSFAVFPFNGPEGYENYKTDAFARDTVTTLSNQIGNYYANINSSSSSFLTDLKTRLTVPHDTVFYSLYIGTLINNYLARDTTGGKKVVTCVYTGAPYIYDEPFLWRTGSTGPTLTREHTFCQSWMASSSIQGFPDNVGGKELLEYNDLHHLFPAHHDNANGKRSNNPLGIVVNATYTAPTGVGKLGTDVGGLKTVYEPRNEHKGDAARAILYMLVRYNGDRGLQWRLPATQDLNILLQWHQQDPPSAIEIARNEYIYSLQKNRNPFIDHPEWVNRINFSNMTYIPDANSPTIAVTAPVANATVVAGNTTTISWTSANVDSVLVEWQMAPAGSFNTIGKYLASQGSINYQFNQNATNHGVVRISSVANSSVNALSGVFKIVVPELTITMPIGGEEWYYNMFNGMIKWTSIGVDSVIIDLFVADTLYKNLGIKAANDSMIAQPLDAIVTNKAKVKLTAKEIVLSSTSPNYFTITSGLGYNENNLLNDKVTVYPVPSNGLVYVTTNDNVVVKTIQVYDIVGCLLQTTNNTNVTLSTKGVYFLQVITNKGIATKRVVVE